MLTPCSQCQRHIRHTTPECPFCHTTNPTPNRARSKITAAVVLGAAISLTGCTREAQHTKYGAPPPPEVTGQPTSTSQPDQPISQPDQPRPPENVPAYGAPPIPMPAPEPK